MSLKQIFLKLFKTKLHIKKIGSNYFSLCPFHLEKTPSCSINLHKMLFHCFGCGAGGTLFKLLNTKKILIKKKKQKILKNTCTQYKKKDLKFTAILTEYFKFNLQKDNGKIYVYLKKRRITYLDFHTFSLGYITSVVKIFYTHHNYYNNVQHTHTTRIILPLKNIYNFVVGFSGRTTADIKPKYLHSRNSKLLQKKELLYGLHLAKEYEKTYESVFVVEGFFDVVAFHSKKIYNTIAILGTHISTKQINSLSFLSKKILLCYDNDLAGNKVYKSSFIELKKRKKNVHNIRLPKQYDPDDFIKNYSTCFLT